MIVASVVGVNAAACCCFLRCGRGVSVSPLVIAREFFLLLVLGFLIVVNVEMSNAIKRLEFGTVSPLLSFLSFFVFLIRGWKEKFVFLIVIFLSVLILGAFKI